MTKRVLVRHHLEMVYEVPDDYDKHRVEFWLNDGTRCQSNLVKDLQELGKRLDPDDEGLGCLCHLVESEYVRDATPDDAERSGFTD